MQAMADQFALLVTEVLYEVRTLEPSGWVLVGLGIAAIFVLLSRPPR